jgi:hypothetical protein
MNWYMSVDNLSIHYRKRFALLGSIVAKIVFEILLE